MRRALSEFQVGPIKTTIPFHIKLLQDPLFLKGDLSTHFVQEMFKNGQKENE
jgi:biotin carboxylase